MFKKSISLNELKVDIQEVENLKGNDVIQLHHKGKETKVLITQEYFFYLQAKAEASEIPSKRVVHNKDKIKKEFAAKKCQKQKS